MTQAYDGTGGAHFFFFEQKSGVGVDEVRDREVGFVVLLHLCA